MLPAGHLFVGAQSRDHRVHHKNSDREGDPYNASRGFFYSHVGWLLLKKPQAVKDAGKQLNFDDLLAVSVRLQMIALVQRSNEMGLLLRMLVGTKVCSS